MTVVGGMEDWPRTVISMQCTQKYPHLMAAKHSHRTHQNKEKPKCDRFFRAEATCHCSVALACIQELLYLFNVQVRCCDISDTIVLFHAVSSEYCRTGLLVPSGFTSVPVFAHADCWLLWHCPSAQALDVTHRASAQHTWLLGQHLESCLAAIFELLLYSVLPQSGHYQASALLCPSSDIFSLSSVCSDVLGNMKREWGLVLQLEARASSQHVLKTHCPHSNWQSYREVMTYAEVEGYQLTEPLKLFLAAWNPSIQGSSLCEDSFAEMQDSIRRSNKSDSGSLANLSAVAIRACHKKVAANEKISGVTLRSEDWEGNQVRSLKPAVFRPDGCPSSSLDS